MPSKYRRGSKSGKPFGSFPKDKRSVPKQIANVKKSVKKIQSKEELKFVDTPLAAVAIGTTPTLTLLNGVAQGDTALTRDGNDITATSIQFRGFAASDADTISGEVVYRHIVFWDQQANGAAPTAAAVLDNSVITNFVNAPYKRSTQKRFKILVDKTFVLKPQVLSPTNPGTEIIRPLFYCKKKRALSRTVKYNGAAATIAEIDSNSLYSMWMSSAASSGTVTMGYRFYYKDD